MPYLQNSSKGGILYIFLAGISWGTGGTVFTLFAPEEAQSAVIAILKLLVTVIFLVVLIMARKKSPERKPWKLSITVVAGALAASTQFCFFNAIDFAGVALGTTIFIGSYPVFAGIFGFLVRKEHPGLKWGMSTGLSITGGTMMTLGSVAIDADLVGVLFALGAGSSFALFATLSKGLLVDHSGISVMAVTSFIGVVLLSPLLFVYDLNWIAQDIEIVVPLAIYLGLVTSILPLLLFAKGLKLVHVATAATLNLIEPLTATLLGVVVLHERLASQSWLGMLLLIIGMLWLSFPFPRLRKVFHV